MKQIMVEACDQLAVIFSTIGFQVLEMTSCHSYELVQRCVEELKVNRVMMTPENFAALVTCMKMRGELWLVTLLD